MASRRSLPILPLLQMTLGQGREASAEQESWQMQCAKRTKPQIKINTKSPAGAWLRGRRGPGSGAVQAESFKELTSLVLPCPLNPLGGALMSGALAFQPLYVRLESGNARRGSTGPSAAPPSTLPRPRCNRRPPLQAQAGQSSLPSSRHCSSMEFTASRGLCFPTPRLDHESFTTAAGRSRTQQD